MSESKKASYRKNIISTGRSDVDPESLYDSILQYTESRNEMAQLILANLLERKIKEKYAIVITNIMVNEVIYGVKYSPDVNTLVDVALSL